MTDHIDAPAKVPASTALRAAPTGSSPVGHRAGPGLTLVGVTRFSVDPACIIEPGEATKPMATLRAALYDSARLRQHFGLFCNFTFPSMRAAAQRHPRFHYVVLVSPRLPAHYKARLYAMHLLNRTWFHLRTVREGDRLSDVTRRVALELSAGSRTFNFRIDDDDAISPDFVNKVLDLSEAHDDGTIVSFDRGYYLQRLSHSSFRLHEKAYPKIAIGLGLFSAPRAAACIYLQGVHNRIAPERVVNVADRRYWIRTLHRENDSGIRAEETDPLPLADVCRSLAPAFGHLALERALAALPETAGTRVDPKARRILFKIQ
jgi:Putative rhamnosyl transferase